MPNIFTTGPISDEERQLYQTRPYSPLSPATTDSTPATPTTPRKPNAAGSHDSLHDYLEGRRPYRRNQTTGQTIKRWLIGPPVLLLCICLVVGLAWLVFSRVYSNHPIRLGSNGDI